MTNTLYIGVDFHPHQQTVAWCDAATGETETRNLFHDVVESQEVLPAIAARHCWHRS